MNIGEAAEATGVTAKMIRHYEQIGLIRAAGRTGSGYRTYGPKDLSTLSFIRRSRDLGFSMDEIATLLGLWKDKDRASAHVKKVAQAHIDNLSERIAAMQTIQRSLQTLVQCCHGDDEPNCPILDDLAAEAEPAKISKKKKR